ncbi:type III secretion system chaperone [Pseudomonas chlororaphis]|uniref:type III secretion system chaperone n=1 Tax=Pseudomonas chlororaphis TaxID=587753 RepID=UPI000F57B420|nr:type III secretion system chaperone [Pseudomonas chlororaphis]AZC83993.1 HrpG [Pseudomonas chlororaphis subsp. piscium]
MKSADLTATMQRWLDSGDSELRLLIDQASVRLQRHATGVMCIAMLSVVWRGNDLDLEAALQLSGPNRRHFRGTLSLDPVERRLCLMHSLKFDDINAITSALEALINQRDVWEAMLEGNAASSHLPRRPLPLGKSYV